MTASESIAINLTWNRVDGVDDYLIYRSLTNNASNASLIGTVAQPESGNQTDFLDQTAESGVEYHYFLKSRIGTAKSLFSSSISGILTPMMSFGTILMDLGLTGEEASLNADPNADGIDNGIAYALGIPLIGETTASERARLPQGAVSPDTGLPGLTMMVPEDVPDDVTLCIETNSDLSNTSWTEIARKEGNDDWTGTTVVTQGNASGGFTPVMVPGTQSIAAEPKNFMRLRVEILSTP